MYFSLKSGITYYATQAQMPPRPILAQQRRPTNAIPILAPPERGGKGRNRNNQSQYEDANEEDKNTASGTANNSNTIESNVTQNPPIGSPENIDHILDNMFVQRAPFQPPTVRKSNSPAPVTTVTTSSADKTSIGDDKNPSVTSSTTTIPNETLSDYEIMAKVCFFFNIS